MPVKTRFAVSPTGFLHVGGLRAALFQYLYAKRNGGTILLRIDDTDQERLVKGATENLIAALAWAGITFDEGVYMDNGSLSERGSHGPYTQSNARDIYMAYIEQLLKKSRAYHCFCSKERLSDLRQQQENNKQPTGYDGHCRSLSPKEQDEKLQATMPYVIRLCVPDSGVTEVKDVIRGKVFFENALIDDQILIKADGYPTYHFATVIDDHRMDVTHVIRGEEWLSSTPKHVLIYQALGWQLPTFAHIPLLVNEKKQKLSKRHGDVSVEDFREKGYLPEALVNFVAFLGWNPGDEREIFSLGELEKEFTVEKVGKASAVFNRAKLDWYNKQYMMNMDTVELAQRALPFFKNAGLVGESGADNVQEFDYLVRVIALEQGRANTLVDLVHEVGFMFAQELVYDAGLLIWKKSTHKDTKSILSELGTFLGTIEEKKWEEQELQDRLFVWLKEKGYSTGDVLWPMRVALCGKKNSPGPFEIAGVLGKKRTMSRIEIAEQKL